MKTSIDIEHRKRLIDAGLLQTRLCRTNGSPTYAAIISSIVDLLDQPGPLTEVLYSDPGEPVQTALYLRLMGAVQRLAIADPACPLRSYYPTLGGVLNISAAVSAFHDYVPNNLEAARTEMQCPLQTNEVGRSAPLLLGMRYIASRMNPRLRLLEVGASAGLNLWLDRYHVCAGDVTWGPAASKVQLCGYFANTPPLLNDFTVVERRGCDLNPLSLENERSSRVLRSFVWPEDVQRLVRLEAAIAEAGVAEIDTADLTTWIARALPAEGSTTVLFHSMVMPYVGAASRERFHQAIAEVASHAKTTAPFARLSLEPKEPDVMELVCQLWPTNEATRLATCTPHGREVIWDPAPAIR